MTHSDDYGRLFSQLRDQPGPLRLADLSDYVRSLGLAPAPAGCCWPTAR